MWVYQAFHARPVQLRIFHNESHLETVCEELQPSVKQIHQKLSSFARQHREKDVFLRNQKRFLDTSEDNRLYVDSIRPDELLLNLKIWLYFS